MSSLAVSILTMGILGALFAFGLSIARKKFKVEEDPRIDTIEELLPGANCGGCGFPGCRAFAEALVAGEAQPDGCPVGGIETAKRIAEVLGIEIKETERKVAVLLCRGTDEASKQKAEYRGIKNCFAADILQKGDRFCTYGCLGFGDCVSVCEFDAIKIGERGIPVIDRNKCTGCGLCVKACPKNILELHPVSRKFFVFCKSKDDPMASKAYCKHACFACKICLRGVENDEIVVVNNNAEIKDLSVMDNEEAMKWVEKCPTRAIGFLDED